MRSIPVILVLIPLLNDDVLFRLPLFKVQHQTRTYLLIIHPIPNVVLWHAQETAAQEVSRLTQRDVVLVIVVAEYV